MHNLGKYPLSPSLITERVAGAGQRLFYVSSGYPTLIPRAPAPTQYVRLVYIPQADSFAAMQAAHGEWCAAATRAAGFTIGWLDFPSLLDPSPDSGWAGVAEARRAELVALAIELTARHASELAVFDRAELQARGLLGAGGPGLLRIDGVALEHIFFGLVKHKGELLGDGEIVALAEGSEERWCLRQVYSEQGIVWGRGVVQPPPGAVAGVELAAVGERVVVQMLARRRGWARSQPGDRAEPVDASGAPAAVSRPLAPALEAALQGGAVVLAPRLSSLSPPRAPEHLH